MNYVIVISEIGHQKVLSQHDFTAEQERQLLQIFKAVLDEQAADGLDFVDGDDFGDDVGEGEQ